MQGSHKKSISLLQKALELNPNYPEAHINLGVALKEQSDLDAVIDSYNTAIQRKTNCLNSHFNLGIVLHGHGQLSAAIASYKKHLSWSLIFQMLNGTALYQCFLEVTISMVGRSMNGD